MLRTPVLSLGAGVQSSVMLLMAAEGAFGPVPPLAVFADTLHEPPQVYDHLAWLSEQVRGRVDVVTCSGGDLLAAATGDKFNPIPLYLKNPDGTTGIGRRQCTYQFKLRPLRQEMRRRGYGPKNPVEMWVGISLDESLRMKPSGLKWVENRWPLVERRISRQQCLDWFDARYPGRQLAKSACVFCPYKRTRDWTEMRDNDAPSFVRAVAADEAMRDAGNGRQQFVSSALVPLSELRSAEDDGQSSIYDFLGECEGMCGV